MIFGTLAEAPKRLSTLQAPSFVSNMEPGNNLTVSTKAMAMFWTTIAATDSLMSCHFGQRKELFAIICSIASKSIRSLLNKHPMTNPLAEQVCHINRRITAIEVTLCMTMSRCILVLKLDGHRLFRM